MARVVISARVRDLGKWEKAFRTHGDLFKEQTVKAVHYSVGGSDEVVASFEVGDLDTYMKVLDSPATAEAMETDGVRRETVKVFVLDKELVP